MARSRLDLHEELVEVLGSRNVYYRPPETVKMKYPCIVYTKNGADVKHANDGRYLHTQRYIVTVIDKNPDSEIGDLILRHFKLCSSERSYTADNLNHDVFNLYY